MPLRRLTRALRHRRQLVHYPGALLAYRRFQAQHPELARVVTEVRRRHLTYLRPPNLRDLAVAVMDAEQRGVPGAIVEAGTALGGSTIILAKAKRPERPLKAYDTFGMIPAPTPRDGADVHDRYQEIARGEAAGIAGDEYYGYREDLLGEVVRTLRDFGLALAGDHIELVEGLYEDTMVIDYPVAVAHVDCDWYSSVLVCLESIAPHLASGGRFIIDDYEHWSGCATAVDEFFSHRSDEYRYEWHSRLHVVKR